MSHTLILNSDAQPLSMLPLSTINWKDAIKLTFLDKVHVLEYYEDWKVHSATSEFSVPSVIMVKRFIRRSADVKLTRNNLYLRDEYKCQYCGDRKSHNELTYDHVLPQSKGGGSTWDNLVAACKPCNGKKGAKIMEPLNIPYSPSYWDLMKNRMKTPVIIRHYSWERFINAGSAGFELIEPEYK